MAGREGLVAPHFKLDMENSTRLQPTVSKYTPKRTRASDGQIFGRMEHELTKITKKLDMINSIKQQQKQATANTTAYNSTRQRPKVDILKPRKSLHEQNTKETPLRDRINSYREGGKTINTFRSEKERQQACQPEHSKQETLKDFRRTGINQTVDCNLQTMSMLLAQNEKLAMRVGELQSLCQSMSHKLGFFKAKYEEETKKLEIAKVDETKQSLYLQKLVYYYKSMCERMNKKLIENGIETEQIISQSSDNQDYT